MPPAQGKYTYICPVYRAYIHIYALYTGHIYVYMPCTQGIYTYICPVQGAYICIYALCIMHNFSITDEKRHVLVMVNLLCRIIVQKINHARNDVHSEIMTILVSIR